MPHLGSYRVGLMACLRLGTTSSTMVNLGCPRCNFLAHMDSRRGSPAGSSGSLLDAAVPTMDAGRYACAASEAQLAAMPAVPGPSEDPLLMDEAEPVAQGTSRDRVEETAEEAEANAATRQRWVATPP